MEGRRDIGAALSAWRHGGAAFIVARQTGATFTRPGVSTCNDIIVDGRQRAIGSAAAATFISRQR